MRIITDDADIHITTCSGTLQEQLREFANVLDAIDRGDTKPYVDNVTERFIPIPFEKTEKLMNEMEEIGFMAWEY